MSSDLSAEITAIATAVLAAFAIITATVAYMAFRRQSQEVAILVEQHERDIAQRRMAQASRVFISLEDGEHPARFTVANTSDQPVYDAEIRWRHTQREAHRRVIRHTQLGTILPGDRPAAYPARIELGARADPDDDRFTVLIFRDAAGAIWVRRLDGDLSELGTPDPDQQTPDQE